MEELGPSAHKFSVDKRFASMCIVVSVEREDDIHQGFTNRILY